MAEFGLLGFGSVSSNILRHGFASLGWCPSAGEQRPHIFPRLDIGQGLFSLQLTIPLWFVYCRLVDLKATFLILKRRDRNTASFGWVKYAPQMHQPPLRPNQVQRLFFFPLLRCRVRQRWKEEPALSHDGDDEWKKMKETLEDDRGNIHEIWKSSCKLTRNMLI